MYIFVFQYTIIQYIYIYQNMGLSYFLEQNVYIRNTMFTFKEIQSISEFYTF